MTTSRWPGDVVPSLPLLRDLDKEGIPDHLVELWYIWQVPVECGFCHRPYSAREALIVGKSCYGRFHRPRTLFIENGYAIVPCVFLTKISVSKEVEGDWIQVDSFEEANSWVALRGPKDNKLVYPIDLAKEFDIPQPTVTTDVQATLTNMMDYIEAMDRREVLSETLNPWEPLVFIKWF